MTEALQGLPRSLRAGAVLTLLAAVAALVMVQWVRQADADRENQRLYEQCLSQAQDVAHVKGCTADFYTRWDGQLGQPDPHQLALESQRLVELRTTVADGPPADPVRAPAPPTTTADVATPASDPSPLDAAAAEQPEEPAEQEGPAEVSSQDPATTPTPQGDGTLSAHPTQGTGQGRPRPTEAPDPLPAVDPDAKPDTKAVKTTPTTSKRPVSVTDGLDLAPTPAPTG